MTAIRKLPIGIQDFESLKKDGYLYVDKTEQIYRLISTGRYYFLSRPRRFGKSMLISTLKAMFEGKRELFEGLAIASKPDFAWEKHPVLHLDLNTERYDAPKRLASKLDVFLSNLEKEYGEDPKEETFGTRFEGVISRACEQTGKRVVILVDEYDKPMLQAIGNPHLQIEFQNILKDFYGALRPIDDYIQFALFTGISTFGKVSIFSNHINLEDISMSLEYNDICGITEEELKNIFAPEIANLSQLQHLSEEQTVAKLRKQYSGYHFHLDGHSIYNPSSLLTSLEQKNFHDYWFETGTPTYLVELIKNQEWDIEKTLQLRPSADELCFNDALSPNLVSAFFQSGYLTIDNFDSESKTYTMKFPNSEVECSFFQCLVPRCLNSRASGLPFEVLNFIKYFQDGNTSLFINRLDFLFADNTNESIKDIETHHRNVIFVLFKLMSFYTQAEYHTSEGRIDMVAKTSKFCYVCEFKLDGSAEEALEQISDKNYTLPFEIDGQEIVRIGINFDRETRNIDKVLVM